MRLLPLSLVALALPATAFHLGLPWGADNAWAKQLEGSAQVRWYHTWESLPVQQLSNSGLTWVPMRWGNKKNGDWPKIRSQFPQQRYARLLAYNEPDVSSQSGYSPQRAAKAFQKELAPLRQYGTKISSPQICYDVKWLSKFMNHLHHQGGNVDFLAVHYYGSWKSIDKLKSYLAKVHSQWPDQKIWVTEYGVTSSSNPSAAQAKQFLVQATQFFASTGYVQAAFPFGMFASPPDSFGSRQNAAFRASGQLRSVGKYYKHFTPSRRSIQEGQLVGRMRRRQEHLLRRLEAPDESDEELWDHHPNETHCDHLCSLRDQTLSSLGDQPWAPSELGQDDEEDDDEEEE